MKKSKFYLFLNSFFLFFVSFVFSESTHLNVLHISFHMGCINEFDQVAKKLNLNVTTWKVNELPPYFLDPLKMGNSLYNVDHTSAERIWQTHKDFFNQFDLIITSDTAPLSRIFLQNHFKKPLIIWVCNRFDYSDGASNDGSFPDTEYYQLIRRAKNLSNVKVISYTPFEHHYASKYRNINTWNQTIKPTGLGEKNAFKKSSVPTYVDKKKCFFIPPYHNDTKFINLSEKLNQLGIENYRGEYAGPNDLKDFKGIIHIPYAWSNLALFENASLGLIYFIPSLPFLLQLSKQHNFFWSPPFDAQLLSVSEWYNPQYKNLFVFFDSWQDLKEKIYSTNFSEKKKIILNFSKQHQREMLNKWRKLISQLLN